MMLAEIVHEAWVEITHAPLVFAAEIVQFVVLLLIVKAIVLGFGKRRGFLSNMVVERKSRIDAALKLAAEREAQYERASAEAAEVVRRAEGERDRILSETRERLERDREELLATAEAETRRLKSQADDTLARERDEALRSVRESFVPLVIAGCRRVLEERFTPEQQRERIQEAILSTVEGLETVGLD